MEVILNPDGTRNRNYRPYIEEEELANSVYLYSPSGRGFHYGLYDMAQTSCGPWLNLYDQYPSKIPLSTIDPTGREHLTRPPYWRYGYERLLRNTIPS